jgi:16S rRNA (guanine966-N2)-methyltransferase
MGWCWWDETPMRVIGGRFRSRKLKSVPGLAVRPTPDRLRESLFSILTPQIEGVSFIDAYAGGGTVGIEALSRGAKQVIFIERSAQALAVLRENTVTLGIADEVRIVRGRAATLLASERADIVFLDPPYDQVGEYKAALEACDPTGCRLVIAQHPATVELQNEYGPLTRTRVLKQGDNSLSFFERGRPEVSAPTEDTRP